MWLLPLVLSVPLTLLVVYALTLWALGRRDPYLSWSASELPAADDLSFARAFGKDFLWGTATAAHQVEGGNTNNQWSRWETLSGPDGRPRVANGDRCGQACDHWGRYQEDIERMKALGVNSYRFSLEWSRIEPSPGVWDEAAIAHYHALIDAVLVAGLVPMLTLHHFTHPLWWEDRGAFEKEENLADLLRFTERMFQEYGSKVRWWCTLNEPEVYASQGYFSGVFPPGRKDPQLTAQVLVNLLRAHGRMYRLIKGSPGGHDVEVGLVKDIFQFDPARSWNLLDAAVARVLDDVMNEAILDTLQTGHFSLHVPGMIRLDARVVEAAGSLDFVGLNYYSHYRVRFQSNPKEPFQLQMQAGERPTDMPYGMYPEGIYRAIRRLAPLKAPILITENGIADAADDRRADWIRLYLYAVSRAIAEGADVRGYYYWSLMDNFEWAEGWHMKFGLYACDPADRERRLREGARMYTRVIEESRRA